ncbi:YajG family lipoprotein [Aquisalimonas lutea]|uniref:YajG family lipoprotein n=1 Tax=Aquisalimonas lutea TaxID=1327750 RepID=UPI0025B5F336|nr:YajG family lipoprotein [Aquisalimonas lutea]MDN3516174.1 YajG family lipoprotein [Aquisalimonas lutea]
MTTGRRMIGLCLAALAVLALGACAQTSQQVRLAPEAQVQGSGISEGREVAVRIVDTRDDPTLGTLENRDQEDGTLTSATDLRHVLEGTVEEALEANGFTVIGWDDNARRRLQVEIVDVSHQVSSAVPREVDTRVELRSEAYRGDHRLTGRAVASDSDKVMTRPDARENAEYLDAVFGRGVGRLLNVDLLDFLAAD